jgi:hypothetical protein
MTRHGSGTHRPERNARDNGSRRILNQVRTWSCPHCGWTGGTYKNRWNYGKDGYCSITCVELAKQKRNQEQAHAVS